MKVAIKLFALLIVSICAIFGFFFGLMLVGLGVGMAAAKGLCENAVNKLEKAADANAGATQGDVQ